MGNRCGVFVSFGLGAVAVLGLSACAAKTPVKGRGPMAEPALTPMPTVPPGTPLPEATPVPLPTRPVGKEGPHRKGAAIGAVISYFGAARADGHPVEPESVGKDGIPSY